MNTVDDLIFTLQVCKRRLPGDAHPVHLERLDEIERRLRELQARPATENPRAGSPEPSQGGSECRKRSAR